MPFGDIRIDQRNVCLHAPHRHPRPRNPSPHGAHRRRKDPSIVFSLVCGSMKSMVTSYSSTPRTKTPRRRSRTSSRIAAKILEREINIVMVLPRQFVGRADVLGKVRSRPNSVHGCDLCAVLQRVRRCVPPSDLRNGYACRLLGLAKRLGRSCYASELIRQQLLP